MYTEKPEELLENLKQFHSYALVYTAQLKRLYEEQEEEKKKQLEKLQKDFESIYQQTIEALAKAIESKNKFIQGHSNKVREYALSIGRRLWLSESELLNLSIAALLHDIGRVGIADEIWNKPGRLSESEYEKVKQHPDASANFLSTIEVLQNVVNIIRHHHERFDGKGYPDGLSTDQIPLESRILAVADAFDAMISPRPHRNPLTPEQAIEELQRNAGSQFDPMVVDAFISVYKTTLKK